MALGYEGYLARISFWLAISVVAFVIWLLGGASGGPWFLWAAVPLGLLMLLRRIAGGSRHDGRG